MVREQSARVLIVADDLTGALDTAGPFAQQGIRTKVVALPLESDAESVRDTQVVSVNTASRHLSATEAAKRVELCVRNYAGQHFDFVFKKIDSTLRGNVVAETVALMGACKRRTALVAPAFPAQGRTMLNGVVHVEGVPLGLTGFAHDALSPPPLQPLGEVFGVAVGSANVSAWQRGVPSPGADGGVVIADANSENDLSDVFSAFSGQAERTLLVGSAGLGVVLAKHVQLKNTGNRTVFATASPIVFVVGSRAQRSRDQVECLRRVPGTVILEAPNGILPATPDVGNAKQIVVLAVEDPAGGAGDAVGVARSLSQAGLELAAKVGADAIVVTGGDTAVALLEASGCAVIDVCGSLMPGIPFSSFHWKGRSVQLITKAGGFGAAGTMADIVGCLRSGQTSTPAERD